MADFSGDADDLIDEYGATLTIVYRASTYSDTGKPTTTWTSRGTTTGEIQPISEDTRRAEQGMEVVSTHFCFIKEGVATIAGDRIRPAGWVAGNDEYRVLGVEPHEPSHLRLRLKKVKGHGG